MDLSFSCRFDGVEGSEIRRIFSLLSVPDMISFAGGMPAPEVFICLTAPLPVLAQRKASRGRVLDISVTADLEVMEELLQTMRDAMIRQSPPPRWITLDTGTEDIQYGSTVDQLLRILEQPVSR